MEDGVSAAWGEDKEGEKGLCGSGSVKAGKTVVKHSLSFVHSFPALCFLLASLL